MGSMSKCWHNLPFYFIAILILDYPSNASFYTRLLVSLSSRLWQSEIRDLLIHNSSCPASFSEFIWRSNPAATILPTDFGLVLLTYHTSDELNNFIACLNKIDLVKYVTTEGLPDSRKLAGYSGDECLQRSAEYCGDTIEDRRWGIPKYFSSSLNEAFERDTSQTSDNSGRSFLSRRIASKSNAPKKKFIAGSIGEALHSRGHTGRGVNVAVFDTGIVGNHPHIRNIARRSNWTTDTTLDDTIGHGSFVAGIIAGSYEECPGLAPDSNLYTFRVFSSSQMSYTSWFLDAFNYALFLEIDVLNFSIGGPDHADRPFADKIDELSANGVIVVSAVGNDGPLWGSIFSPADQGNVIGVGGWDSSAGVASFSSRGMTTYELSQGGVIGRVKPDILAASESVYSSTKSKPFGCTTLSGTSFASPVVAGAVTLLLSTVISSSRSHSLSQPPLPFQSQSQSHNQSAQQFRTSVIDTATATAADIRAGRQQQQYRMVRNVAAMKQILIQSASRFAVPGIFEQGAGLLNISKAYEILNSHSPHASLYPARVSNLEADCPYMWPYCTQRMYPTAQPPLVNFTLLNSMGVSGRIVRIIWTESFGDDTDSDIEREFNTFTSAGRRKRRREDKCKSNSASVDIEHSDSDGSINYRYTENEISNNSKSQSNGSSTSTATKMRARNDTADRTGKLFPVVLKGRALTVAVQLSDIVWPWSGHVAISVTVNHPVAEAAAAQHTEVLHTAASASVSPSQIKDDCYANVGIRKGGIVYGRLAVTVESPWLFGPPYPGLEYRPGTESRVGYARSVATAEVVVDVDPAAPLRSKRILWDVHHNIGYPSAFVPRDDLEQSKDSFDWLGDHPYTNYRGLLEFIQSQGYHVEILNSPWTCFNASDYLALLVIDPEDDVTSEEVDKVEKDVREHGLSLLIIADWYDELQIMAAKYQDDNTRSIWHAISGGANVPAINKLLTRFDAQLGLQAFSGQFQVNHTNVFYPTGNTISRWPRGGYVLIPPRGSLKPTYTPQQGKSANLRAQVDQTQAVAGYLDVGEMALGPGMFSSMKYSLFGLISAEDISRREGGNHPANDSSAQQSRDGAAATPAPATAAGKVVVYGDSNCFDMISLTKGNNNPGCRALMKSFLDFIVSGSRGLATSMGATAPAALAPGWPYLKKIATHGDVFHKPELMDLSGGGQQQLSAEEQRRLAIERKGRQWEFSRFSRVLDKHGKQKPSANVCSL